MSSKDGQAVVDYAGRTVDLLLLKTVYDVPVYNKRVGLDVTDVVGEPMIVSGIEKMAQRFALSFINAMGSTKFVSGHGTNLVPDVGAGRVYDMATLESTSAKANLLARTQIMSADADNDTPDDERLVDSSITKLEFDRPGARVKISITLTSAAGESYIYIVPVPVGVH